MTYRAISLVWFVSFYTTYLFWFGYIRVMDWMVWFQINFLLCMVWFGFWWFSNH
jgi:hypothetical protein